MTAAEALAAAAAEGLTLVPAENATGFKGVEPTPIAPASLSRRSLRGGRSMNLGCFATAEEAALAVARFLGPEGAAHRLAAAPMRRRSPRR